jgi:hypothetical protein
MEEVKTEAVETRAKPPGEPKPPKPKRRLDDLMNEAAQIKVLVERMNAIEKRGVKPDQIAKNRMRNAIDALKGRLSKAKRSLHRVEVQLQEGDFL